MMRTDLGVLLPAVCLAVVGATHAETARISYPKMAPIEQYRLASRAEEIALARSAAPASISDHAEVLVLGTSGYETAAKGANGFVCIVERAWANDFDRAEFWNPEGARADLLQPGLHALGAANVPRANEVGSRGSLEGRDGRPHQSRTRLEEHRPARGGIDVLHDVEGWLPRRRRRRALASTLDVLPSAPILPSGGRTFPALRSLAAPGASSRSRCSSRRCRTGPMAPLSR